MAPPDAGIILEEKIKEVGMKSKCSSLRQTMGAERFISDNHQQNLSFSDVRPADVTVRKLGVDVDVATSFTDTFKTRFTGSRVGDMENGAAGGVQRKKILTNVSADFPAGTLTAIIGGSGSGKVRLHLRGHSET